MKFQLRNFHFPRQSELVCVFFQCSFSTASGYVFFSMDMKSFLQSLVFDKETT